MASIVTPVGALNKHIAHVQSNAEEWEHSGLARELHRRSGIFQAEWGRDVPHDPVLHFAPLRNAYACYDFSRADLGVPDNVTCNTHTLVRPPAHTIRTLGHELLHFRQQHHGKPSAKRNWHNDAYVKKAESVGIRIDHQGCTSGRTEAFAALISEHGIDLPDAADPSTGLLIAPTGGIEPRLYGSAASRGAGSKLKKWTCACTITRASADLRVLCRTCGKTFRLAGKG